MSSTAASLELESMFPDIDRLVISEVLRQSNNNAQLAVDKLLRLNQSPKNTLPTNHTPFNNPVSISPSRPHPPLQPIRQPISWVVQSSPRMNYRPRHIPPPSTSMGMRPGNYGWSQAGRRLIIIRGLPGSGKSTLAKQLAGGCGLICSTDDFFIENGRYIFDPAKLSINHEKNQDKAIQAMKRGVSPVIIDNTNSTAWEMKPYVAKGLELQYDIEFREPDTSWKYDVNILERTNTHGVGRESLERMLERYQYEMTITKVMNSERPSQYNQGNSYHSNRGNYSYDRDRYQTQYRNQSDRIGYQSTRSDSYNWRHSASQTHTTRPQIHTFHPQTQTTYPWAHTTHTQAHTTYPQTHTTHPRANTTHPQTHTTHPQAHTTTTTTRAKNDSDIGSGNNSRPLVSKDSNSTYSVQDEDTSILTAVTSTASNNSQLKEPFDMNTLFNLTLNPGEELWPTFTPPPTTTSQYHPLQTHSHTTQTETHTSSLESNNSEVYTVINKTNATTTNDIQSEGHSLTSNTSTNSQDTMKDYSNSSTDRGQDTFITKGLNSTLEGGSIESDTKNSKGTYYDTYTHTNDSTTDTSTYTTKGTTPYTTTDTSTYTTKGTTPYTTTDTSTYITKGTTPYTTTDTSTYITKGTSTTDTSTYTTKGPTPYTTTNTYIEEDVPVINNSNDKLQTDTRQGDLDFLQSCFTHFKPTVIERLYTKANSNLSLAVDLALHLPEGRKEEEERLLIEEEETFSIEEEREEERDMMELREIEDSEHLDYEWLDYFEEEEEEKVSSLDTSHEDKTGEEEGEEDIVGNLGLTEEEYANVFNNSQPLGGNKNRRKRKKENKSGCTSTGMRPDTGMRPKDGLGMKPKDGSGMKSGNTSVVDSTGMDGLGMRPSMGTKQVEEEHDWDDSNLLLRLTPSLAKQLQTMFGPIPSHLLKNGIQSDKDLIVLLSESTAKGIYKKWMDTLEAKGIEYQFSKGNAPPTKSKRKRNRKKVLNPVTTTTTSTQDKSEVGVVSEDLPPPNFHEIMDEQFAEQIGQQEVEKCVLKEMKKNEVICSEVSKLYQTFPHLSHSVIHWHYYKSRFTYSLAQSMLYKVAPPPSHRRPTAASSTYSKPGTVSRSAKQVTSKDHEEEEEEVYDYDDLRTEAAVHAKLRSEAFQKAAEARGKKEGELAMYYAQQGHLHTEKMNEANRRAAEMTYKLKNKGRPKDTLDLHCLHVNEAIGVLKDRLLSINPGSQLYVITGRGIHSKGTPRLKPAVVDYLKKTKYNFYEVNAGLIRVTT